MDKKQFVKLLDEKVPMIVYSSEDNQTASIGFIKIKPRFKERRWWKFWKERSYVRIVGQEISIDYDGLFDFYNFIKDGSEKEQNKTKKSTSSETK